MCLWSITKRKTPTSFVLGLFGVYVHEPSQSHTLCSHFLLSTCVAVFGSEEGGERQGKLLTQPSQVE